MGNRHLRRASQPQPKGQGSGMGKGKAARHARSVVAGSAAGSAVPDATTSAKVEITADERVKLAEDLAYFNVSIYREATPGEIRKDDIERAEKEIIAAARRTP